MLRRRGVRTKGFKINATINSATSRIALTATVALLCHGNALAQFSACTSPASDPDGDGYGWENGESCIVSEDDFDGIDGPDEEDEDDDDERRREVIRRG
ncbi:MAG: hypothetical protein GKR94_07265 [Gammaproteobacteria bacterium]|nr:hypothetical protein [Gammaproteobacteria bacterium]